MGNILYYNSAKEGSHIFNKIEDIVNEYYDTVNASCGEIKEFVSAGYFSHYSDWQEYFKDNLSICTDICATKDEIEFFFNLGRKLNKH